MRVTIRARADAQMPHRRAAQPTFRRHRGAGFHLQSAVGPLPVCRHDADAGRPDVDERTMVREEGGAIVEIRRAHRRWELIILLAGGDKAVQRRDIERARGQSQPSAGAPISAQRKCTTSIWGCTWSTIARPHCLRRDAESHLHRQVAHEPCASTVRGEPCRRLAAPGSAASEVERA